jgi:capsular polysaccharide export protein
MTLRLPARIAVLTHGILAVPTLPALLGETMLISGVEARSQSVDAVLAWGRKPSADIARRFARQRGVPMLQVEDGFLRSMGLGSDEPPLSIVVDDLGIYYDATTPSRLEALIAQGCGASQAARARALIARWRALRVSKYNDLRDPIPAPPENCVVVADQTLGDASIAFSGASAASFQRMLEAALDEHPGQPILLKVHPDVATGAKHGHFGRLSPGTSARVTVWAAACHPAALLDRAAAVYTVSSQLGFEALLRDKPVRCFGMPFYAGWGLSSDELPAPPRRRAAALPALAHAALVAYPRYLNPETGRRCEVENLLEYIGLQRRMRQRFPPLVHAVGFSVWKKPIVRAYFSGSEVRFVKDSRRVPPQATLAVWGNRSVPPKHPASSVVRLEDGFVRSVGLGADLIRPLSLVQDPVGLYYDASRPSGLEQLLATTEFDPALLARARALRECIVIRGVTKYNVGSGCWQRPVGRDRVVLVAGQVESDTSLALSAPSVRTNMALLRAARAYAPDAWLIYKPHPDVVARLRQPGGDEADARALCDEIVVDAPMESLLRQIDELHVMTSLSGFEALLRGRRVVTHGQPFYAGWGLTEDLAPPLRRQRRLNLDALVAATLILYPSYVSRVTGRFTTPERALDELQQWRAAGSACLPAWHRWWRQTKRAGLQMAAVLR